MAGHCVISLRTFELIYTGTDERIAREMAVPGTHWVTADTIAAAIFEVADEASRLRHGCLEAPFGTSPDDALVDRR